MLPPIQIDHTPDLTISPAKRPRLVLPYPKLQAMAVLWNNAWRA